MTTAVKKALDCRQTALNSAQEARTLSEKILGLGYTDDLRTQLIGVAEQLTQSYHSITELISSGQKEEAEYAELFEEVKANCDWLKSQKAVCNAMKKSADAQITALTAPESTTGDAD